MDYDSRIIDQHAEDLYRQAAKIVLQCTIRYGLTAFAVTTLIAVGCAAAFEAVAIGRHVLTGGLGGYVVANPVRDQMIALCIAAIAVFTALGLIWGHSVGQNRAFSLRLQAQSLLCWREIEKNTRAMRA